MSSNQTSTSPLGIQRLYRFGGRGHLDSTRHEMNRRALLQDQINLACEYDRLMTIRRNNPWGYHPVMNGGITVPRAINHLRRNPSLSQNLEGQLREATNAPMTALRAGSSQCPPFRKAMKKLFHQLKDAER